MSTINWGPPKQGQPPASKPIDVEFVPADPGTALVPSQPAPALPTQEISPEALDELFARDPREITDAEFEAMVLHYRSQRGRFVQAEKDAAAQGKKQTRMPKQEGPKEKPKPLEIKLTDLNLAAIMGPKP